MKPNVIWEIERADLDWLPASWPQLVEALRRHGLSTTSSLEDLLRDADRDGRPRIEVPISAAVERSRFASERSGVLTVVATAQTASGVGGRRTWRSGRGRALPTR
jgi:hypothetical protein